MQRQVSGSIVGVDPSGSTALTAAIHGISRISWSQDSKQGAIKYGKVV